MLLTHNKTIEEDMEHVHTSWEMETNTDICCSPCPLVAHGGCRGVKILLCDASLWFFLQLNIRILQQETPICLSHDMSVTKHRFSANLNQVLDQNTARSSCSFEMLRMLCIYSTAFIQYFCKHLGLRTF